MDGPLSPLDWGVASAKVGRNARLTARFERLIERYQPCALILEAFDGPVRPRSPRTQDLCRTMIHLAAIRGMETPVLPRHVVQDHFARFGARTRFETAQFIGQQIDALHPRLPRERRPWMPQDSRQALFDAAALAITYLGSHPGAATE